MNKKNMKKHEKKQEKHENTKIDFSTEILSA